MTERARQRLPFGSGLDRASGLMVVQPAVFSDLRNVHLIDGRAELRKGLLAVSGIAPVTDVIGIFAVRSQGVAATISFNAPTGEVALWQTNPDGTSPSLVGTVWTFAAGFTPPRVIADDSDGKLIIAHDEPTYGARKTTRVWDVLASTLTDLVANLDGMGDNPVKFRGVVRYLEYIFGWGYGTNTDPDRPETVRNSLPGRPTTYDPNHYFLAGQRGDPVMDCKPAGRVLAVRKEAESYDIIGTDRPTFGILPADGSFGQAASRAGITVNGINYFWSLEGPRRSTGGVTEDLALPLDLGGPSPDALVDSANLDDAFAVYLPVRREILFVFGQWAYVLHLADPTSLRWSYRVFAQTLFCGRPLYGSAGTTIPVPTATINAVGAATDTTIPVTADITGTQYGGESLELWVRPAAGAWSRNATVATGGVTPVGISATGLDPLVVYDVAVRVTRAGVAAAGYTSTDPSTWPAAARGSATTTLTTAPVIGSSYWERTGAAAEQITLTLTAPLRNTNLSYVIQFQIGGVWTDQATTTDRAAGTAMASANGYGETTLNMRVLYRATAGDSPVSGSVAPWIGPEMPADVEIAAWAGHLGWYAITWTNGPRVTSTLATSEGSAEVESPTNTQPIHTNSGCPALFVDVGGQARHKYTSFGVDDFSDVKLSTTRIAPNC